VGCLFFYEGKKRERNKVLKKTLTGPDISFTKRENGLAGRWEVMKDKII